VKDTAQTISLDQAASDSERFEALKDFNVLGHAAHHPVEILRFNTCGSVDDGKSTLIGRLLYDSKSLMEDQLEALQRSADITGGMNAILADVFALYFKTKNFHWHMSGPHFRDYHLLLDEQADQIYAMGDPIAERIRKVGGSTLRSIGHIARLQRIKDNDADYVEPLDMLAELREDNQALAARLREVHDVVDEARDIATASLIENWIDETERRTWFLFETLREL